MSTLARLHVGALVGALLTLVAMTGLGTAAGGARRDAADLRHGPCSTLTATQGLERGPTSFAFQGSLPDSGGLRVGSPARATQAYIVADSGSACACACRVVARRPPPNRLVRLRLPGPASRRHRRREGRLDAERPGRSTDVVARGCAAPRPALPPRHELRHDRRRDQQSRRSRPGKPLRVRVTAKNASGSGRASNATGVVQAATPPPAATGAHRGPA